MESALKATKEKAYAALGKGGTDKVNMVLDTLHGIIRSYVSNKEDEKKLCALREATSPSG